MAIDAPSDIVLEVAKAADPARAAAVAQRLNALAGAAGAGAADFADTLAATAPAPVAPASALSRCATAAARVGSAALATSSTMSDAASMAMASPQILLAANIRPLAYAELDGGLISECSTSSARSLRSFWSRYLASRPSWTRSASLARAPCLKAWRDWAA